MFKKKKGPDFTFSGAGWNKVEGTKKILNWGRALNFFTSSFTKKLPLFLKEPEKKGGLMKFSHTPAQKRKKLQLN